MRCIFAGRALARVIAEFPDLRVEKVEYLTNRSSAREAGVRSVPALVAGGQKLTGLLLTRSKIRGFLESVG